MNSTSSARSSTGFGLYFSSVILNSMFRKLPVKLRSLSGIDVVAADAVAIRVAGDARDLRDQPQALAVARLLVEHELGVAIQRRQRADRADEDAHRMGVVLKPFHQLLDVLVQQRVLRDGVGPGLQLLRRSAARRTGSDTRSRDRCSVSASCSMG